jgi:hypothetical protein
LHTRGIERFVDAPGRPTHTRYLERMGFQRADGMYILDLKGEQVMKDARI